MIPLTWKKRGIFASSSQQTASLSDEAYLRRCVFGVVISRVLSPPCVHSAGHAASLWFLCEELSSLLDWRLALWIHFMRRGFEAKNSFSIYRPSCIKTGSLLVVNWQDGRPSLWFYITSSLTLWIVILYNNLSTTITLEIDIQQGPYMSMPHERRIKWGNYKQGRRSLDSRESAILACMGFFFNAALFVDALNRCIID
ncbi:hypothetical protein BDN70DRAFT_893919 [Pholiota conissans]|uniref:Uncharacterized protein n=1 Tax=Pholiota conissans TaxID=109636 RepID=A0A9P6D240_9AGAR|nr:hypothetical protein BDN70DRAFT_893919 [Pholiota conissans]